VESCLLSKFIFSDSLCKLSFVPHRYEEEDDIPEVDGVYPPLQRCCTSTQQMPYTEIAIIENITGNLNTLYKLLIKVIGTRDINGLKEQLNPNVNGRDK
jgi:hypothetical protein